MNVIAIPEFRQRYKEHEIIVETFKTGDSEYAQRSMETHLLSVREDLIKHMKNNVPAGMRR